ncbi:DUF262 domain-containing protein [Rhodococcus gannanensis]|uniref:DUF262 domain-containing protein n=1 Tax=Rhodococcus gannanensis TaxID=1960308 RepID=A0ABW4P1N0_9NOCA
MAEKIERRQSFQTIAWFRDLYKRDLLDLDPPYQRRSVWNQKYRDFFIETVMLGYPAPAIFVHEEISSDGSALYRVVDGKQRLTTLFDFTDNDFPVAEDSALKSDQNKYFADLDDETKRAFWRYQFSVEYLPTTNAETLTNVFDRINRNVARLTRQELRHARFNGVFATTAERLNDHMFKVLADVPHIATNSKRQMKDVELTAQLLLLIEMGVQSFSQDDLDDAYSDRDSEWDFAPDAESIFRESISVISSIVSSPISSPALKRRLRNQADFYTLFDVVTATYKNGTELDTSTTSLALTEFYDEVVDESKRAKNPDALGYYEAARSASNDRRQRVSRSSILKSVIDRGRAE